MSLRGHLIELRRRLVIVAIALVAGLILAFFITDPVIGVITEPIREVAASRGEEAQVEVMFTTVTGPFDLRLRMSFAIGIFLAAPIWIWQIWAYVMPGLTRREIAFTWGFLGAAIPLFFAGAATGLLVLPNIVRIMSEFTPDGAAAYYDATYYYDFVFKLLLFVGVAFVLPVFLVVLNFAGILTGRAIFKGWRIAVVVAVTFAALATPPSDVMSTFLLAGILLILYFAAAGLSVLFDRRRRKRQSAVLTSDAPL